MTYDLLFTLFYSCRSLAKNNNGLKCTHEKNKKCNELLLKYLNLKVFLLHPVVMYKCMNKYNIHFDFARHNHIVAHECE